MNRQLLNMLCEVSQKASLAKNTLKSLLKNNPEDYNKAREYLNDIQSIIASYCDVAPIRLINGEVDEILKNHSSFTNNNLPKVGQIVSFYGRNATVKSIGDVVLRSESKKQVEICDGNITRWCYLEDIKPPIF